MTEQWHTRTLVRVTESLRTNVESGLSTGEAQKRYLSLGPNVLAEVSKISPVKIFAAQFQDFMVLVLLATTLISLFLGEIFDALAILTIVLLNSVLGFFQEYKAERSMEALKKLTVPQCKVLRDGHKHSIPAQQLVPGDVILLEAGDRVPADSRLIESMTLSVDESNFTGESVPVNKTHIWIGTHDAALGDHKNMVYMSTMVTRGSGKAVVVATGMDTEIGKIAHMIQASPQVDTPLQTRLRQLGKFLVIACLVIVGVVFATGVKQGFPVYKMFMVGVTLAVAAIPEGLPAVVTIALAVGVQRMSRQNAIVRQLPAVETLGCATVICSDKTGTLTQNKMTVQQIWTSSQWETVWAGQGLTLENGKEDEIYYTLVIGSVCTRAEAYSHDEIFGDPTEAALVRIAIDSGLNQSNLRKQYRLKREIPFDSERKRMSVLVEEQGRYYSFVKGAPDIILQRCSHVMIGEEIVPLTRSRQEEILAVMDTMGSQALRILAMAWRSIGSTAQKDSALEENLIFCGLVGMIDPPRPQVSEAIRAAGLGGIRTIMVTGDHKNTAAAIAKEIGILTPQAPRVLTGLEWERLTSREQQEQIKTVSVFARVAPSHKLSIVRALQKNGEIVGMTGDGVNDAPAVKEADIGISMGIQGTDVTREASAMVLADDNYETIISAIKEGRGIYDNIRKFIRYLLACNVGEVLTMFVATLVGLPLPLVPIQILWMNLVTDGLPAIALGLDPMDPDIMLRSPRPSKEGVFARRLLPKIMLSGLIISSCTLGIFLFSLWYYSQDISRARTLAFTTLVMAQLIFVFQCRSEYYSIFQIGFLSNLFLVLSTLVSAGMHLFILYNSTMQSIFQTIPLTFDDWLLVAVFATWSLLLDTVFRMARNMVKKRLSLLKV
ncbi:MAG: calcium-translocating P-type ATPase, SERCA-type [Firmicutes bacterium]|nr:calcium-translocating P-type ATPase, SERCA-type [Bacillota bacterium]